MQYFWLENVSADLDKIYIYAIETNSINKLKGVVML